MSDEKDDEGGKRRLGVGVVKLNQCGAQKIGTYLFCILDRYHWGKHQAWRVVSPFPNGVERVLVEWDDEF